MLSILFMEQVDWLHGLNCQVEGDGVSSLQWMWSGHGSVARHMPKGPLPRHKHDGHHQKHTLVILLQDHQQLCCGSEEGGLWHAQLLINQQDYTAILQEQTHFTEVHSIIRLNQGLYAPHLTQRLAVVMWGAVQRPGV